LRRQKEKEARQQEAEQRAKEQAERAAAEAAAAAANRRAQQAEADARAEQERQDARLRERLEEAANTSMLATPVRATAPAYSGPPDYPDTPEVSAASQFAYDEFGIKFDVGAAAGATPVPIRQVASEALPAHAPLAPRRYVEEEEEVDYNMSDDLGRLPELLAEARAKAGLEAEARRLCKGKFKALPEPEEEDVFGPVAQGSGTPLSASTAGPSTAGPSVAQLPTLEEETANPFAAGPANAPPSPALSASGEAVWPQGGQGFSTSTPVRHNCEDSDYEGADFPRDWYPEGFEIPPITPPKTPAPPPPPLPAPKQLSVVMEEDEDEEGQAEAENEADGNDDAVSNASSESSFNSMFDSPTDHLSLNGEQPPSPGPRPGSVMGRMAQAYSPLPPPENRNRGAPVKPEDLAKPPSPPKVRRRSEGKKAAGARIAYLAKLAQQQTPFQTSSTATAPSEINQAFGGGGRKLPVIGLRRAARAAEEARLQMEEQLKAAKEAAEKEEADRKAAEDAEAAKEAAAAKEKEEAEKAEKAEKEKLEKEKAEAEKAAAEKEKEAARPSLLSRMGPPPAPADQVLRKRPRGAAAESTRRAQQAQGKAQRLAALEATREAAEVERKKIQEARSASMRPSPASKAPKTPTTQNNRDILYRHGTATPESVGGTAPGTPTTPGTPGTPARRSLASRMTHGPGWTPPLASSSASGSVPRAPAARPTNASRQNTTTATTTNAGAGISGWGSNSYSNAVGGPLRLGMGSSSPARPPQLPAADAPFLRSTNTRRQLMNNNSARGQAAPAFQPAEGRHVNETHTHGSTMAAPATRAPRLNPVVKNLPPTGIDEE
jgi:hypothetical protein